MVKVLDEATQRFYEAERGILDMIDRAKDSGNPTVDLFGSSVVLPVERRFGTLENVQTYTDRFMKLNWVRELCPDRADIIPRIGQARTSNKLNYRISGESAVITIPDYEISDGSHMRELMVLHELSHHLTLRGGHGQEFLSTYIDVLDHIMGPEIKLVAYFMLNEMEAIKKG